ncbi:hypothetical protein K438DRAFT_1806926 [Mycena galopus ATCC 62051]|nr:hypothetical protein K438DRAFT_1806926 [Mycena galopus ATCC 62051]
MLRLFFSPRLGHGRLVPLTRRSPGHHNFGNQQRHGHTLRTPTRNLRHHHASTPSSPNNLHLTTSASPSNGDASMQSLSTAHPRHLPRN